MDQNTQEQTAQSQTVQQPVQEKTKQNNLPMIVLILVTISSLLLSVFLFYQNMQLKKQISDETKTATPSSPTPLPTSDETSSLETYNSSSFKFLFKYPDTGTVETIGKRDDLLLGGASFKLSYDDGKFRPQASEVYVYAYDSNNLSLQDWLKQNSTDQPFGSDPQTEFYEYKETGQGELGSISGIKFQDKAMGFVGQNIAVKKDNYIYVLGWIKVADDLSNEYSQILSTFKFTD